MNAITFPSHDVLSVDSGAPKETRRSSTSHGLAFLAAVGVHAAVLFVWQRPTETRPVEFGVVFAATSVEVALVAALPAEETSAVSEIPPEVEKAIVPPDPVVPPAPIVPPAPVEAVIPQEPIVPVEAVIEKTPELAVSLPVAVPVPPPKPVVQTAQPKPKVQSVSKQTKQVSGDGRSAKPGTDATTAAVSSGASSAKPGYLRNPHPAYPEASRRAGEQGVVAIRVSVDELGQVTAAIVARSSGFPMLDERARSTVASQWRFKPAQTGGRSIASQVVIPIRFTLDR